MTKKSEIPSDSECIYDKDGFKMRAAAVCIRDESESEVLLVSSFTKPDSWIVPAGKVQFGEEYGACAQREAEEEGGARGRLGRYLGSYEHQDRHIKKRTSVFVLYVDHLVDDFQERDKRKRQWFPIQEAFNLLIAYKPQQGEYLKALQSSSLSLMTSSLPLMTSSLPLASLPTPPAAAANKLNTNSANYVSGNGCGSGSFNNRTNSAAAAAATTAGCSVLQRLPFLQDSLVSKEAIKKNDLT